MNIINLTSIIHILIDNGMRLVATQIHILTLLVIFSSNAPMKLSKRFETLCV